MSTIAHRPHLVSLAHVKESSPHVPIPDAPKRIMAWPGGKIQTNKEEATLRFLKKKQALGQPLTAEQLNVIKLMASGLNAAKSTTTILSSRDNDLLMRKMEMLVAKKRRSSCFSSSSSDSSADDADLEACGPFTLVFYR